MRASVCTNLRMPTCMRINVVLILRMFSKLQMVNYILAAFKYHLIILFIKNSSIIIKYFHKRIKFNVRI